MQGIELKETTFLEQKQNVALDPALSSLQPGITAFRELKDGKCAQYSVTGGAAEGCQFSAELASGSLRMSVKDDFVPKQGENKGEISPVWALADAMVREWVAGAGNSPSRPIKINDTANNRELMGCLVAICEANDLDYVLPGHVNKVTFSSQIDEASSLIKKGKLKPIRVFEMNANLDQLTGLAQKLPQQYQHVVRDAHFQMEAITKTGKINVPQMVSMVKQLNDFMLGCEAQAGLAAEARLSSSANKNRRNSSVFFPRVEDKQKQSANSAQDDLSLQRRLGDSKHWK
jgi:hypothetical protein